MEPEVDSKTKLIASNGYVRNLVRTLDGRRFIRWKDSIQDVIEKEPQRILATESMEDTEK